MTPQPAAEPQANRPQRPRVVVQRRRKRQRPEHATSPGATGPGPPPPVVNFYASDVAAACGYSPYSDTVELAMHYIYQGWGEALDADALELGMVVQSEDEHLEGLVAQAGGAEVLQEALAGAVLVKDTGGADQAKAAISETVAAAVAAKAITAEAGTEMSRALHGRVNKGFGTRNEGAALEEYERQRGTVVHSRNDELMTLDDYVDEGRFRIVGKVDGMTEDLSIRQRKRAKEGEGEWAGLLELIKGAELVNAQSDQLEGEEAEWVLEPVVVEVKNRMSVTGMRQTPNIHDCIQMVAYMKMTGANRGDLVQQCVEPAASGQPAPGILVCRVDLEGSIHGSAWDDFVIPRLTAFSDMVHSFRADQALRLAFLAAVDDDGSRRRIIAAHCPFLE